MNTYECTPGRFLESVKSHQMTIELDDGVNRSIHYGKPGEIHCHFRLNTWRGHLCFSGDMGTFVFSRLDDMFEFFRAPDGRGYINPRYWGEKLKAISTFGGYREFNEGVFRERVNDQFNGYWEDREDEEGRSACWDDVQSNVLSAAQDGEAFAYMAVHDFESHGFRFDDFFDSGGTEILTYQYVWCCYALVWGINQYDLAKEAA